MASKHSKSKVKNVVLPQKCEHEPTQRKLSLVQTGSFKRDIKRCIKRGLPIDKLQDILSLLEHKVLLPKECRTHELHGIRYKQMECHILFDWVLVWQVCGDYLLLLNTGYHSELFDKKK